VQESSAITVAGVSVPLDVFSVICGFLAFRNICRLRRTAKSWQAAVDTRVFTLDRLVRDFHGIRGLLKTRGLHPMHSFKLAAPEAYHLVVLRRLAILDGEAITCSYECDSGHLVSPPVVSPGVRCLRGWSLLTDAAKAALSQNLFLERSLRYLLVVLFTHSVLRTHVYQVNFTMGKLALYWPGSFPQLSLDGSHLFCVIRNPPTVRKPGVLEQGAVLVMGNSRMFSVGV
jgi:hypothetical protein